jgi:ribosomal protein S18 acetylase RimI-like enzyme
MTPRQLGDDDLAAIDRLHQRCAEFWELIDGAVPSAAELMHQLPPGVTRDDKHVFGIADDRGELVALIDASCGYPAANEWFVSLLLLDPAARGRGLGPALYAHVEDFARSRGGTAMHLIVQDQNPRALAFWTREGFVIQGKRLQQFGPPNVVTMLAKRLR